MPHVFEILSLLKWQKYHKNAKWPVSTLLCCSIILFTLIRIQVILGFAEYTHSTSQSRKMAGRIWEQSQHKHIFKYQADLQLPGSSRGAQINHYKHLQGCVPLQPPTHGHIGLDPVRTGKVKVLCVCRYCYQKTVACRGEIWVRWEAVREPPTKLCLTLFPTEHRYQNIVSKYWLHSLIPSREEWHSHSFS